jgi:hypothetical protein
MSAEFLVKITHGSVSGFNGPKPDVTVIFSIGGIAVTYERETLTNKAQAFNIYDPVIIKARLIMESLDLNPQDLIVEVYEYQPVYELKQIR